MQVPPTSLRTIAPNVLVATSAFWSTTTTVLLGRHGGVDAARSALLIDPGVLPEELARHPGELTAAGLRVVAGACTHLHWDHVLWPDALSGTPRYATPVTVALAADARATLVDAPLAAEATERPGAAWPTPTLDLIALDEGDPLPWPGPEVRFLASYAHLPGHGSLLCAAYGILVLGDLLSDVDVPFPFFGPPIGHPEGVGPYRAGLDRLATVLEAATVDLVVPGHGRPTDRRGALARLDADRRYLDLLDRACSTSATLEEALERAEHVEDARLADPAVRAAHEGSVRCLFRAWSET